MHGNLYRIRCINDNTSEPEPFFVIAPCRESAAVLFYILNNRDLEKGCELFIEIIYHHEDAQPA